MNRREPIGVMLGVASGLMIGFLLYQSSRMNGGFEVLPPLDEAALANSVADGGYYVNCSTCSCEYSPAASPYQDPGICEANIPSECGSCGASSASAPPSPCAPTEVTCAVDGGTSYYCCAASETCDDNGAGCIGGPSSAPPPPPSSMGSSNDSAGSAGSAASPC
jgi:hypothetical protein